MQKPYNHDSFSKISRTSTALQKQLFLKNIENFLCKEKIVNNRSIPSTHTKRKISDLSVKHSFTLYPSLSPYGWTESLTEEQIHSLHVGWRNFFSSCGFVSVFGSGGK
jgi:hypothetical protein